MTLAYISLRVNLMVDTVRVPEMEFQKIQNYHYSQSHPTTAWGFVSALIIMRSMIPNATFSHSLVDDFVTKLTSLNKKTSDFNQKN